ncbi:MAG TPA: sugar ABC transporter permease [Bacteroidetes bacterium]|nr:sugar ABC transporter permease [Bacteroidota bacterium]
MTAGIYTIIILFTIIAVYPILRVISISLRPGNLLHTTSLRLIPENATLQAYLTLFTKKPFLRWLLNSTIVSGMVTILGVALASTAGYAFSRFKFRGREFGMISVITTQMFPVTMLLIPLFIMLIYLHLYDTFLGLVIAYSATVLPFCIWQMKGYYDTIPVSLEEAARIDGSSQFGAFYRIVLPLAAPALVITALFSFMGSWSEYLVAAVILNDQRLFTLPLGLKQFQSNFSTEWGLYAAGAVMVSIPVIILFLILSRWLISGLTLGSVKE